MEKFTTHTGIGVPLRQSNVDTDQIIPAVYLKRITRTGYRRGRQHDCRDHESPDHQVFPDADEHGNSHRKHRPAADPADSHRGVRQHRVAEVASGSRRAGAGHLYAVRHGRQRGSQRRHHDQDQLAQ